MGKSVILKIVLPVLLILCSAKGAYALSVESLRFGAHPEKTRMVLELSDVSDFRVFILDNPYRVVVDLPTLSWESHDWRSNLETSKAKTLVKNVRYGQLQKSLSRIVVDVASPVVVQNAFLLPERDSFPDRLVIDFTSASRAQFEQAKSKVYGTLDISSYSGRQSSPPATQSRGGGNKDSYEVASLSHVPPLPPSPPAETSFSKTGKPLVIIDPGHGGVDPGAIGANGIKEKDIALAMSLAVKKKLLETGNFEVKMTRTDDRFLKLADRVNFARKHAGDIFVSIHADSINKSHIRGASIYTLSETASDAQTARLAKRENQADQIAGINLASEEKDVANILIDLAMRETMNQSKFFANTLVNTLEGNGIQMLENPHRFAGFAVLKAPDIPSVLVEAGFISNVKEARLLWQPQYRERIASSLVNGIEAYFERVNYNNRI